MYKTIRNGIVRFVSHLGLEIMPSWALHHDVPLARHLEILFKQLEIRCVLDIGANNGGYRNFLRYQVGYGGLIISFEPVKKNHNILNTLAKNDPLWINYGFALGNENTKKAINVTAMDVFSSFLKPDYSNDCRQRRDQKLVNHEELVEIKKLDSIIEMLRAKHSITNIFMKMDTQGYDMEVIKGASDMISTVMALQSELSVRRSYESMPNYTEVLQLLGNKGFDITGMFPVSRDSMLRIIEFDCTMINRFKPGL